MKICFRLFYAATITLLCITTAGCGLFGTTQGEGKTPQELVALSLATRKPLTNLKATGSMRITDHPSKFSLGITVDIAACKPDRMRIKATKIGGSVDVFDVVVVGEDIAFYVPRKRTLFRGQAKDLDKSKVSFSPSEILDNMMMTDNSLLQRKWKKAKLSGRRRTVLPFRAHIFEEIHKPGEKYLRYIVDASSMCPFSVEKLNANGDVTFAKTYRSYKKHDFGTGEKKYYFPYRVELEWPQDQRLVAIAFKDIEPEVKIPEEAFDLEVPERTRVKPITNVEVEGDTPPRRSTTR